MSVEQLVLEEYKLCEICNNRPKYCKEMCQHCYLYYRKLKLHLESPFIPCACGCGTLIHSIGKNGMSVKHVHHHTNKKGEEHNWWKGGRTETTKDYIDIYCPDHPHSSKRGYVKEHRLVMEKFIGRYLIPEEVVHHIDKNVQNNDISNLMLFANDSEHKKFERIKDMSDRCCSNPLCKYPNKTNIDYRTNRPIWFHNGKDKWLCNQCYRKKLKLKKKQSISISA